jgi:hypothetical protein
MRSDRWPKWACRRAPVGRGTARTLAGSVRSNGIHYTRFDGEALVRPVKDANGLLSETVCMYG